MRNKKIISILLTVFCVVNLMTCAIVHGEMGKRVMYRRTVRLTELTLNMWTVHCPPLPKAGHIVGEPL